MSHFVNKYKSETLKKNMEWRRNSLDIFCTVVFYFIIKQRENKNHESWAKKGKYKPNRKVSNDV
jgi:hypothetical protein